MTSTDRLAEMAAEIERLERDNDGLDEIIIDQARVIADLHARIAELEALVTVGHGTMGTLQQPDEPATITHGHPPSAPPHDE